MAAFSSDGAAVMKRKVDIHRGDHPISVTGDFADLYEINRCSKWIQDEGLTKVALQFPDELLCDSASILHRLQALSAADFCILADTSYGSCCVDEVAAEHYQAQGIIHYGQSCLSPTQRLPVLYVFGRVPFNVQHCCEALTTLVTDAQAKLVVLYDVVCQYAVGELEKEICKHYADVVVSRLELSSAARPGHVDHAKKAEGEETGSLVKFGRRLDISALHSVEDYTMFFVGGEGSSLTNFMMLFNKCTFYSYDPLTREARKESINVNKLLMKRYYLVEKAKDAKIVGILVGTLGVMDYLHSIARLKEVIKKAGKRSYTFVVGKLNVAKLANFAEVDIFVLVACSQNSLLDSAEFYKPVVTPFEMEMACNPQREWMGNFVADFRELLPGGSSHVELPKANAEVVRDVSLITGGVRSLGIETDTTGSTQHSGTVVRRDDTLTVVSAQPDAGMFLSQRSWKGLDPQLGETPVTSAIQGTKGIAASYTHEPT